MQPDLEHARRISDSVRLRADVPSDQQNETANPVASTRDLELLSLRCLEICSDLTPSLDQVICNALTALEVQRSCASAFIVGTSELNASCASLIEDRLLVRITSALAELLEPSEMTFVVGHELGHHLMGHAALPRNASEADLDFLKSLRAQELSADRIGLIAARDVEVAVMAMIKTMSGLSAKHLDCDVRAFMRQLQDAEAAGWDTELGVTHPSFVFRARALMWFAMSDTYRECTGLGGGMKHERVEDLVHAELDRYYDNRLARIEAESWSDIRLWSAAFCAAYDGILTKAERGQIEDEFGHELAERITRFLVSHSRGDAAEACLQRVLDASREMSSMMPDRFREGIHSTVAEVSEMFGERQSCSAIESVLRANGLIE